MTLTDDARNTTGKSSGKGQGKCKGKLKDNRKGKSSFKNNCAGKGKFKNKGSKQWSWVWVPDRATSFDHAKSFGRGKGRKGI